MAGKLPALSAPPPPRCAPQLLFLPDVLRWRASTTPEHLLFLLLSAKVRPPTPAGHALPA